MKNDEPPLVFAWAFTVFGTAFAAIGIGVGAWSFAFALTALRTEGTVVQTVMDDDMNGAAPMVRYEVDGKAYQCQSNIYFSHYSVGDKVAVLFQPARPGAGWIDSLLDRWMFPLVFGGGGLVFAGIGYRMLFVRRRIARGVDR